MKKNCTNCQDCLKQDETKNYSIRNTSFNAKP